ncbi:DUF937 domain-containing protein [Alkalibacter mobilis]|uniref:DUF937 domain-containing protein n=1 Tax=Alkalibacter mobilis TaxID=2787712 RepID=UPI0018A0C02B|nr:DUF937 domain-containing protein [Alkalibacter mobilis]MBF7097559.1 DUF937 domain-containing protein [Alkalibacter mobilis]
MDIFKFLSEQINDKGTLSKLGDSVGAKPEEVQKLTQMGVPVLLQAMGRNASTKQGAESLAGALNQHQDDNIDDIQDFLDNVNKNDGEKMLQHIFSENKDRVQNNLAKKTGLESNQVTGLLTQLAPLLIGALAQQKKEKNLDPTGVAGLLGGLTKQRGGGLMDMVSNLLDSDDDGSIVDDVGNLLKGFLKK